MALPQPICADCDRESATDQACANLGCGKRITADTKPSARIRKPPTSNGDVAVPSVPQLTAAPAIHARRHVAALDGLRGVAILFVLFDHLPPPFAFLRPFAVSGWCGVDLFFVLSGYLITGILYSSTNKENYFRNFYARRSLRIFPLYYGFMVMVLIVLPKFINPYWLGQETLRGGVMRYFLYYTNYASVFSTMAPAALAPFWSLAVEEHFYLFWPTFIKLTPKNKLLFWCALIALSSPISRFAITVFKGPWIATYLLTTSRLDALVLGAIVAILVRQHPDWLARWAVRIGGSAAVIVVAIGIWRHGLIYNDSPMRTFGYSLLAVMFASVVWVAGNTKNRLTGFLANPILVTLGNYSYCIYVFHALVLKVCERWLGPHVFPVLGWRGNAPLPTFLVTLTGSLAIAYLSWHFYERPFLSLKARFGSPQLPVALCPSTAIHGMGAGSQ